MRLRRGSLLRLDRRQRSQAQPAQVGLEAARVAIHRIPLPQPAGLQVAQDQLLLKDRLAPDREPRLPPVQDLAVIHRVVRQEAVRAVQEAQAFQAVAAPYLQYRL